MTRAKSKETNPRRKAKRNKVRLPERRIDVTRRSLVSSPYVVNLKKMGEAKTRKTERTEGSRRRDKRAIRPVKVDFIPHLFNISSLSSGVTQDNKILWGWSNTIPKGVGSSWQKWIEVYEKIFISFRLFFLRLPRRSREVLRGFGKILIPLALGIFRGLILVIDKIILLTLLVLSKAENALKTGFVYFKRGAQEYLKIWKLILRGVFLEAPKSILLFFKPEPPLGFEKALVSFVCLGIILVLPLKALISYQDLKRREGLVLGAATRAFDHLKRAKEKAQDFNFEKAEKEFKEAHFNFIEAKKKLEELDSLLSYLIKLNPQTEVAQRFLEAGQNIASAGQYLSLGLISSSEISTSQNPPLKKPEENLNLTQRLKELRSNLEVALPKLERATSALEGVREKYIPQDKVLEYRKVQENLPILRRGIQKFLDFSDIFLEILGDQEIKRYLVIFQNNNEIRPTGGFMGSFALVDIAQGELKKIEIPGGGTYDLQGQLLEKIESPKPLWLINPAWQLQDANWFPDFRASAKKTIWFYGKSGGPSVDGVIAITATFIEDLLKLTGPIEMPEYGKIIKAENFRREIQKAVEFEYDREENQPKKIIADLTPRLLEKVLGENSQQSILTLLPVLEKALREKDLLFYFEDPQIENWILTRGWAGEIRETERDYLSLINTNIGGGKTDGVIEEEIDLEVEIKEDGSGENTLTITRHHQGRRDDIFEGATNRDYLRVYLPEGSELLKAFGDFEDPFSLQFQKPAEGYRKDEYLGEIEGEGIIDEASETRISKEFGKTVFSNWVTLKPKEEKEITFKYRLPFKLKIGRLFSESDIYSLLLQKQPGMKGSQFKVSLRLPPDFKVLWQKVTKGLPTKIEEGRVVLEGILDRDIEWGMVIIKK